MRQLPLFDPPIDPGHAGQGRRGRASTSAASSAASTSRSARSRSPLLIQKALELAGEVRALGTALLAALEKGDAEHLALLRQGHEIAAPADDAERALPAVAAGAGGDRRAAQDPGHRARALHLLPAPARPDAGPERRSRRHFDAWTGASSPRTTSTTPTARWSASTTSRSPLQAYPELQLAQGLVAVEPVGRDRAGAALPERERGRRAQHALADGQGRADRARMWPTRSPPRVTPIPSAEVAPGTSGASASTRSCSAAGSLAAVAKIAAEIAADHARGWRAGPGRHRRADGAATSAAPTTGCCRPTSRPAS